METLKVKKRKVKKRRLVQSSFQNDWLEAHDFWRTTRRNLEKKIRRVIVDQTLEKLEKDKKKTFPLSDLEFMNESLVVVGTDGEPLVYFLKGGLGWPFLGKNPSQIGFHALKKLKKCYPPPPPKSTDVRHLDLLHGTHQGAYHFALWHATGHAYCEANEEELTKGAVISKDTIDTAKKFNATMEFLHAFTPITQAVGALFQVIDQSGYNRCKERFDELAKDTAVSVLKTSKRNCFLGMAILAGLCCLPHRDEKDSKTRWVVDMGFGNFEGGDLEVPQVGYKFGVRQGDVIFMKSALLQHSISSVEKGYRYGVVYFSHESVSNIS